MIIQCPLCQTRYIVPVSLFAQGPRNVRCMRCRHSWQADVPPEIEVVAPPEPEPVLAEPVMTPIPQGSNLPALRGFMSRIHIPYRLLIRPLACILGLLASMTLLWLLSNREDIEGAWPRTVKYYDAIGLHLAYTGEGLGLDHVRSDLVFDSGIMRLNVSGEVINKTEKEQLTPDIMASAVGSDGEIMQSWQIDAPTARLAPHAAVPFRSTITAPRGTVSNINLTFIEPKHAD